MMGRPWLAFAFLFSTAMGASGQDHLIPDVGSLVDPPDEYRVKVRHVFRRAFEWDVTLRAVVLPSFEDEYVVGVRVEDETVEAFLLEPSSSIWDTEILRMYESGEHGMLDRDETGKPIPSDEDEDEEYLSYLELKKRTPADYREIKANWRVRPLPEPVAEGLLELWETMLVASSTRPNRPSTSMAKPITSPLG